MRKAAFLLTFITILYASRVDAQRRDTVMAYMKKLVIAPWLPLGSKITRYKDSADFIRMITVPQPGTDNHLFPVNDYYLNGVPRLQCNSNTGSIEAQLQGICVEYFPDGRKKRISNYDKGTLSGDITEYFPNGKLYLSGVYRNDTLIVNRCNDSTGRTITESGNGVRFIYAEDFKRVIGSGGIKNGLKDGSWSGTLEDTISYIANYTAGNIVNGMSLSKSGRKYPFNNEYTVPEFVGGLNMFGAFLSKTIRYPQFAVESNIQGKVIVIFTIDQGGSLHNIHLLQEDDDVLSKEALRVMRLSPKWQPATSYGIPVTVVYATPIGFSLKRN